MESLRIILRRYPGIPIRHIPGLLVLGIFIANGILFGPVLANEGFTPSASAEASHSLYLPIASNNNNKAGEWPQLGQNAQRSNYSPFQVDPPYCFAWKWYETPMASRAQPVVSRGRLFVGDMEGVLHARDATSGAPLWKYASSGPIRHSAGVLNGIVVFSSHDGYTYALDEKSGNLRWKTYSGPSATAPLLDQSRNWVYIASTNGDLMALDLASGDKAWVYHSEAPILTSPSLSRDRQTIFTGNEAVIALAINANNGQERWRTALQGQSLSDRYPVVTEDHVIYRSQPLHFFHWLLAEGDEVLENSGSLQASVDEDWELVRPSILAYLESNPDKQTFFVLNTHTGQLKGIAPVLYTYGNNDVPNVPVVGKDEIYLTYRARRGIQTDSGTIHVTTEYDAELGTFDLSTLDIAGLTANAKLGGRPEFRMTSDEPAMLTMGGDILWVDNWERAGGINVNSGQLIHIGAVSNDWPECSTQCGPGSDNPFFPLNGNGPAYPFPSPRVTEGNQRGGIVIANGMLYWRVIQGGLAGITHREGQSCPAPVVWNSNSPAQSELVELSPPKNSGFTRDLAEYVSLDLATPVSDPLPGLVERLKSEVEEMTSAGQHLLPYFLERGFSTHFTWPYNTAKTCSPEQCAPVITYLNRGNAYWHDPGELLYALAMAYPYLGASLQEDVKAYMAVEMERYSPLQDLPWEDNQRDWLRDGKEREFYQVPFREDLNPWPPPAASLSSLYALWLWSRNTGDWTFAQEHWDEARALFEARKNTMIYYSDIGGAIGYARIAQHFGYSEDYNSGLQAAVTAMSAGLDFDAFRNRAEVQYKDPRDAPTGWSAPVFYGLTPEVGLYLREQFGGKAENHLADKEDGDGLRWWYLTRAGVHAEIGETSYLAPMAAWSHFLAHAYITGDSQHTLQRWLDRPWGIGDLYSIQKIVATIQAGQ